MYASYLKRATGIVAAIFVMGLGVAVQAADSAAGAAAEASNRIDRALQNTANDFNRELDQATNQLHEAQRTGTSPYQSNRFGNEADIDREINETARTANKELRQAADRDEYTFQRRQLENTRSLYYPGSEDYDRFTRQMDDLDRRFGETGNRDINWNRDDAGRDAWDRNADSDWWNNDDIRRDNRNSVWNDTVRSNSETRNIINRGTDAIMNANNR